MSVGPSDSDSEVSSDQGPPDRLLTRGVTLSELAQILPGPLSGAEEAVENGGLTGHLSHELVAIVCYTDALGWPRGF